MTIKGLSTTALIISAMFIVTIYAVTDYNEPEPVSKEPVPEIRTETPQIQTETVQTTNTTAESTTPPDAPQTAKYAGYDIYDVTQPSNITKTQLHEYLDRFPELQPIASILADNDQYVNAVFLLAVIRLESGNGRHMVTKNNLGSVKDFYTGEYVEYATLEQGAEAFVGLLKGGYINESGLWYSGLSVENIRQNYNPEYPEWTDKVADIMDEIHCCFSEQS